MTLPACRACNLSFHGDETKFGAVVSTVSSTEYDQLAASDGGWLHKAFQGDRTLKEFIDQRLDARGVFHPDQSVFEIISRIAAKTATGLLIHEFGRIVLPSEIEMLAVGHTGNVPPEALIEQHRRDDALWAEVTPSGRELERQVVADFGQSPAHMARWHIYVRGFFEYMFIKRTNCRLLTAMKIHEALTVLVECPWPATRGPRRRGKPPIGAG